MKNYSSRSLMIGLALVFGLFTQAVQAQTTPVTKAHTQVELVSQYLTIVEGRSFYIGLRLTMEPEWHVYWRNPGDSGLPPKIKWDLPPGYRADPITWPRPERIDAPPLVSYGYEGDVFFPVKISAPGDIKNRASIDVQAKVSWLACKVECIPGVANFSFSIPVVKENDKLNPKFRELYKAIRFKLPAKDIHGKYSVWQTEDSFIIRYLPTDLIEGIQQGYFFPYDSNVIQDVEPQKFRAIPGGYEFEVRQSEFYQEQDTYRLKGILTFDKKGYEEIQPIEIDVPIQARPAAVSGSVEEIQGFQSFFLALVFAFLGGLILNLMPCVLPVLSIKILSLVEKSQKDSRGLFGSGLQFTAGIIVSFWVLAGAMLILRHAGNQIGWGFQFQSPAFVVSMAILFFMLALNLFGMFEIGVGLTRVKSSEHSFMNGVLATIVATPCTAPFMGSALGYTLTQPAWNTFMVYTALGFGMAFPYLLLTRYPGFLKFVPKPGAWMNTMKQFFGFVLAGVVIWLMWVLSLQKSEGAVITLGIGLFFVGFGFWVNRIRKRRDIVLAVAVLCWIIGGIFAYQAVQFPAPTISVASDSDNKSAGISWEAYTPELLEGYMSSERPIFLDFTAAWCLSCQVNDRVVFGHPKVIQKFRQLDVVPIKADWTNHDPQITKAINQYGKNSIPLYVLYPRDKRKDPVILPELITPGLVTDTLTEYAGE